jgi:threonine aldolase
MDNDAAEGTQMDTRALFALCDNRIPGHGPPTSLKARLANLVSAMDESDDQDLYGSGHDIRAFEVELAAMFGKDAAVFMPSGTMAQQIALRIWCERSSDFTVAFHPSAHLEFAEQLGYQYLHGLKRLQFGVPEMLGHRALEVSDFRMLGKRPGAVLIELPYRPLGGVLPCWQSMSDLRDWARGAGVPLHLDGARIWQCADAYRKSYAEIGEMFDSVYVSFYKDIGALCGAALIGDARFIDEARLWQRRHGGNLYTQAPFVVSARQRLREVLPKLPSWNVRARELAERLDRHPRIRVNPYPPAVNFFAVHFEGNDKTLLEAHHALAERTGTFLFDGLRPDAVPGFCRTEVHCWENAAAADLDRVEAFIGRLLDE